MLIRTGAAMLVIALGLVTPAAAVAPGVSVEGSHFTIGISGFVPVVCRAHVDATMVSSIAGTAPLGALNEFCNSPAGYVVVADRSAALGSATLLVDGKPVPLAAGTSTIVSQSNGPAVARHDLALQLAAGAAPGSLSFRIEPR